MSDELLTVAEVAGRLGVTVPRLRRWLGRPENAHLSFQVERQTRTGTRTAVVVPVSVLPQIEIEQKREQEQERPDSFSLPSSEIALYVDALLREKDARIVELTTALEHEREQSRIHAEVATRAQTLLALSGPVQQPEPFWRKWFRHSN